MTTQPAAGGPLVDATTAAVPSTARPDGTPRPARPRGTREAAPELPFAQVLLDTDLSPLGRPVDQLVPASLDQDAQPGVRVRCRVDGELVDGYLLARAAEPSTAGDAEWLQKVVSPVRVLTPEILELARTVADKYIGTVNDVLRLAIPPRSAAAEKKADEESRRPLFLRPVDPGPWGPYGGGREFVSALERKDADTLPRALWTCLPGADWALEIATAMHAMATETIVYVPREDPLASASSDSAFTARAPADTDFAEMVREPPRGFDRRPGTDGEHRGGGAGQDPDFPVDADFEFDIDIDVDVDFGFDTDLDPRADADYAVDVDPDDFGPDYHPEDADGFAAVGAAGSDTSPVGEPRPVPGRGALAIVPGLKDLTRLDEALTRVAGPGHHVVLSEELGNAKRYQNWLAVLRGEVRMVIGTRAALFAPVADLGLVAVWDDGDERHAEPQPPYPHVREVLLLRAHQTGAAALVGGYSCTAEGAQLVASRWAHPLSAFRSTVRAKAPEVHLVGEEPEGERTPIAASARLPNLVWRTVYTALAEGPVLVQVPQNTDLPLLICMRCGRHARCAHCHGPFAAVPGHAMAQCEWCGRPAVGGWRCDGTLNGRPCGNDRFRTASAPLHTPEELARAFPGTKVLTSGPTSVVAEVGPRPALIVATPGAEPVAEGGYAAVVFLDAWALLGRPDLRAGEEALRRWLNAAALVRPADQGGLVVVDAAASHAPVHAVAGWDPVWHARFELEQRAARHLPPLARVVELTGTSAAVAETLGLMRLPGGVEVLGPVALGEHAGADDGSGGSSGPGGPDGPAGEDKTYRALVRVPRHLGGTLAASVRQAQTLRGVRGAEDAVRVRVDPIGIGSGAGRPREPDAPHTLT